MKFLIVGGIFCWHCYVFAILLFTILIRNCVWKAKDVQGGATVDYWMVNIFARIWPKFVYHSLSTQSWECYLLDRGDFRMQNFQISKILTVEAD